MDGDHQHVPHRDEAHGHVVEHGHGGHVVEHGHDAHDHVSGGRLAAAAGLNVGFAVVQVVVGLLLGSIVVLADSLHQIVDALGLVTALVATRLAARPSSDEMTFGWGKTDALGGLLSGLLLLGSLVWIAVEAVRRLLDPVEVAGGGVVAIGLVAIAVNGGSLLVLGGHAHHHDDGHALRAARLHLVTDLLGSVVVVAAGLALVGTGADRIDPIASLLVSALVMRATIGLMRGAVAELLDRVPSGIGVDDVEEVLGAQPGVERVHHVHVRPLGRSRTSVTAHVVVDGTQTVHDAQTRVSGLTESLRSELGVEHATIQLECHPCLDDDC